MIKKKKKDKSLAKHLVWRVDDKPEFQHSEYKVSLEKKGEIRHKGN